MANIVNIERDMLWAGVPVTNIVLPAPTDLASATATVATSGAVNQIHGFAQVITGIPTLTINQGVCVGTMMLPSVGDNVPYRVKGMSTQETSMYCVGVVQATAATVTVTNYAVIATGRHCDEIVCLNPQEPGGQPFCFFAVRTHHNENEVHKFGIGVQRLISKPDQYASAVS